MPATSMNKRRRGEGEDDDWLDKPAGKRLKVSTSLQPAGAVTHALLALFYSRTMPLRAYLLERLPTSSKIRRKKIASVAQQKADVAGYASYSAATSITTTTTGSVEDRELVRLLDQTIVAIRTEAPALLPDDTGKDAACLESNALRTSGGENSMRLLGLPGSADCSQSEIVDYVVWCLLERHAQSRRLPKSSAAAMWPQHLLCDGYRQSHHAYQPKHVAATRALPALIKTGENSRVQMLKDGPWPQLLKLLGKTGDSIMANLLLGCAIFLPLEAGQGNLYQLSGVPIHDLSPIRQVSKVAKPQSAVARTASEITFVRHRMLYSRPAVNARGCVKFGLRHIHVLNRHPYKAPVPTQVAASSPPEQSDAAVKVVDSTALIIMMYIFPRQFGLHNVFTSHVDSSHTAQKFQDYTLRHDASLPISPAISHSKIPKRLRGAATCLVKRLQIKHHRCSYAALLQHYCPLPPQVREKTKGGFSLHSGPSFTQSSLVDLASPIASVSAFCQAVFAKVIPDAFWGVGATLEHNKKLFLAKIHQFIMLRRFERISLHELVQGFKIADIEWLAPPHLRQQKCSASDRAKRHELFLEFLYYLIDSLLIPLIRSNFYVTESAIHRTRLLFFRHDVWRSVAEPAMAALRTTMFEEVKAAEAKKALHVGPLGVSQVRLLPKVTTMRPIMNLRRKTQVRGDRKNVLGPSINTVLAPLNCAFKLERARKPSEVFGASLFSVGDMYERIKRFKSALGPDHPLPRLYLAKVDVRAAFDTIPQHAVLALARRLLGQREYPIRRHFELRPGDDDKTKVFKKWHTTALPADGHTASFLATLERDLAGSMKNTIFVDRSYMKAYDTRSLMALLKTHIQHNMVRIGKKYYRQKTGIPQGSVVSSLLCNYFYADMEQRHLAFLRDADSLLLRLIDDSLLITTDAAKARRFVEIMHAGLPEYGVTISLAKSLVNFPTDIDGVGVPRLPEGEDFPYCGVLIDTRALDVSKDRRNVKDTNISNSLSVEFCEAPGRHFRRKVMNAFKFQSHPMFFDHNHNTPDTVLSNLFSAFEDTAIKMWAYLRCLPRAKQPRPQLIIDTIHHVIHLAFSLLTSKARAFKYPTYRQGVHKSQLAWLAIAAFRAVLVRKQARFGPVIAWLATEADLLARRKEVKDVAERGAAVGGFTCGRGVKRRWLGGTTC